MKKLILILGLLSITATAQAENMITSKMLVGGLMSAETSRDWSVSVGYVRGVVQTQRMYQLYMSQQNFNVPSDMKACISEGKTVRELSGEFVFFVARHPAVEEERADVTLIQFLFTAYPCGDSI